MKKIVVLLVTIALFLIEPIKASHIAGGDLSYTCLGNNQYQINLNLFVDCSGFDPGDQQTVNFTSTCGGTQSITVNVLNSGGTEISQLCPSQIVNSTCNGGNLPGMWAFNYVGTVTLSPQCDTWNMSWDVCCRNSSILNLSDADSQGSYIGATLNSVTDSCNNSPSFTSQPIPYVCTNQTVVYSYGVVETDGDSLHYSLVSAMDAGIFGGAPINLAYNNGYSATAPIPGITIDPNTGVLTFTPTTIGNFVVVVLVEEYDINGNLIGTVMRDIQFVVQNCSGNSVPDPGAGAISGLTGTAAQSGPFALEMCEGSNFTFTATFSDPDLTDSLVLTSNIATVLPGAILTTTGANPLVATVSWVAPGGSANTNTSFSITINDGACPVVGQQTYVYDINVNPRTLGGADKIICGPQTATLNGTGGTVFTWNVISGDPMVVGTNFSCNPCANPVASPSVTTVYEIVSDLSSTCVNRDTVTVTVVPDFTFTTSQSTDTLCLNQQIQLNAVPSPAGTYTYVWTPAIYLDDDSIANPLATMTVAGTYDKYVSVTSPLGCLKKDTVTFLVRPEIRTHALADTILCVGQSANLSANGGSSFAWSSISGTPVTVGTNFSCNPCATALGTPSVSTVYQVTSNLGGTCVNKDTVSVTVVPNFTTTTTQSETITCLLQPPIQLSVIPSPSGTYTYSWTEAQFLNNATVANPVATITSAGVHNFIATVTSAGGCVKKDTATVTITPSYKPDPIAYVTDPLICAGDTAQISLTFNVTIPASCGLSVSGCGGTSSAISGTGTSTNSATGYPAPYGNYYNSAKHQFLFLASELTAMGITGGKIDQLDFNVAQINGLTTYHEFTINMGCTNATAMGTSWLTGLYNVYTPKNFTISTGWNGHVFDNAFEWDGVSNVVVEICFSEIAQGTFWTNNSATTYTTTSFVSCAYDRNDVTPACAQTTPSFFNFGNSNNRPNVRFHYCGAAPDSSVYSYNWYTPTAFINPNLQNPSAVQNTAGTTQYYVVVTDTVSGCFDTAYVNVTAQAPAVLAVSAGNDTTVCPGIPAFLTATGAQTYTWGPATGLSSINTDTTTATPSTTITYTVTGTSECTVSPVTDTVKVTVLSASPVDVTAGGDQEICGTPYNLMATSTGGYGNNSYLWTSVSGSIIDSIQNATAPNATVNPSEANLNIYQITVTDFCGDTASDYVAVNVIMDCKLNIPNVFTPNGDGKNDVFLVTGVGMQTYSISIFDRWGKKVYESTNIKEGWDGSSGADGTYFYTIKAESVNGTMFDEQGYLQRLGQ